MKAVRWKIDSKFLRSAVGRRMLAVVGACAVLPVAAFAFFSYQRVSRQLEADAQQALREASKAASMGILERLMLAEYALQRWADISRDAQSDPGGAFEILRAHQRLSLTDPRLAFLSARERSHLERGQTLLVVDRSAGSAARLLLGFARDPTRRGGNLEFAEVEPDYLFAGLRSLSDLSWVEDSRGAPIFAASGDPGSQSDAEILTGEWTLFLRAKFGADSWTVRIGRPAESVHRPLREFEAMFPWIVAIALLSAFSLSLQQIRRTLGPIVALTEGAERIAKRDYRSRVDISTRDEFGRLSEAFNAMAETTDRHIEILSTVNRVGGALSAQSENGPVIEVVLQGSMQVTGANAGALFLIEEDNLGLASFRVGSDTPKPFVEAALPRGAVERCMTGQSASSVREIASVGPEELEQWRAFDAHFDRPVTSYLTVPLRDEKRENAGVLLLLRNGPERFSEQEVALAESLASQATVAIRKNQLVESFRGLFEGLIQLTVIAIDEKSPYTGDHCRNVPILAELIADAACADQDGPMKDFHLSAEERYELRIAALLHDCGKVVTPVHVMDKATKLQTIFDRIGLIETRFEVLRLETSLRAVSRRLAEAGLSLDRDEEARLSEELQSLDADLAFLRKCNVGAEQMADSSCERVRQIAGRYRWTTCAGEERCALEADEIENLIIRRGTLNDAERKMIEHHVVATMKLLEQLPFPRHMRNVPTIAGAHHERIDGRGYPLRLRGEQLSVQARILSLADVFEALTARDRPYKPGKTLRETLSILRSMVESGHIDPDLYEVFLRDKLHLRYAAEHMSSEQIDPEFHAELEELTGP